MLSLSRISRPQPVSDRLRFPSEVNEYSARLVATGVVIMTALYLDNGSPVLLGLIAFGFVARVLSGPTLSPLGQLVTRVVTPAVESMTGKKGAQVPGPPKQFAQAIGATLSLSAVAATVFGIPAIAVALIATITVAASIEAFLGYCIGCAVYAQLMRRGVLPDDACVACNDISLRHT